MKRRDFLKAGGVTAAAATTGIGAVGCGGAGDSGVEWRNKQPGMAYRRFGRTNMMVSEIVIGGIPVNSRNWQMLEKGLELGINYIDTAIAYGNGDSETAIANVIDSPSKRARVFIATKASPADAVRNGLCKGIYDALNDADRAKVDAAIEAYIAEHEILAEKNLGNYGTWQFEQVREDLLSTVIERLYADKMPQQNRREIVTRVTTLLDESLGRLKTDYVDVLMCPHGTTAAESVVLPEILEAAYQLKKSGKIRYFGVSAHNNPAGVLRAAADSAIHDMAMVAYNVGNAAWVESALAYAGEKDLGVIAMKVARAPFPDRGERNIPPLPGLVEDLEAQVPGDLHIAQKAYVWALRNRNVHACVSAINNEDMMISNAALAGKQANS